MLAKKKCTVTMSLYDIFCAVFREKFTIFYRNNRYIFNGNIIYEANFYYFVIFIYLVS